MDLIIGHRFPIKIPIHSFELYLHHLKNGGKNIITSFALVVLYKIFISYLQRKEM